MASTQTNNIVERRLRHIAVTLGILQATAWCVMSLICIVMYARPSSISFPDSYMDLVGSIIYKIFLAREVEALPNQILTPLVFLAFIVIYLLVNFAWVGVSTILACNTSKTFLKQWSLITVMVCLLDFIFVIILGADYSKCLSSNLGADVAALAVEEICANGILPVLVIAAKGFTLWFVNAFLAWALFQMSRQPKVLSQDPYTGL